MKNVITRLLIKSANRLPIRGMIRYAFTDGAYFSHSTCMFKFRKKREKGHEYNLTYDNLAVPEIHTHEPEDAADEDEKKPGITYDSVAIPEIHIRKR